MVSETIGETYGLSASAQTLILQIIAAYPHIEEVILFGSRAKGNYKPGSDIDLAVKGKDINKDDISGLSSAFEESLLPYFVDVVNYATIKNEALKEHIDRVGIRIYPYFCK